MGDPWMVGEMTQLRTDSGLSVGGRHANAFAWPHVGRRLRLRPEWGTSVHACGRPWFSRAFYKQNSACAVTASEGSSPTPP
jgi:hypothetical protein